VNSNCYPISHRFQDIFLDYWSTFRCRPGGAFLLCTRSR